MNMFLEHSMAYPIIITLIFTIVYGLMLFSVFRERRKLKKDRNKINKICVKLYDEYEKVKGPQWAEANIKSIIKEVIKKGTARFYHV